MNWAPPVVPSSRLHQPLWSGPQVDDGTGVYCNDHGEVTDPSEASDELRDMDLGDMSGSMSR